MTHSHPLGRAGRSNRSASPDPRRPVAERLEDRRLLATFATGDVVQFESVRYGGRYLDGDDASTNYDVDTRSNASSADTDWRVRSDNNGIYSFENVQYPDRWLDGDSGGNVDLRNGDANNDTNWRVTNVGGDVYRLENVQFGGGYLDADGGDSAWKVDLNSLSGGTDLQWRITPVAGGQSTFGNGGNPWGVGGSGARRIQAENFDAGGNGVSWNESDAVNQGGGNYRASATGVDVFGNSVPGGGIGYFDQGEWLEYTVNVASAGNHTLRLRGAVDGAGNFRATFDGSNKTGDVAFGSTGGWNAYATREFTVNLAAGTQVLRIEKVNGGGLNLDWVELQKQSAGGGVNGLISLAQLNDRGSGYAYADGLLTNQATMNSAIEAQYLEWRGNYRKTVPAAYSNANGGGTMYFVTGFDQKFAQVGDAVSEGLGYGMILASLYGDRTTFDGIWNYAQTKLNANGLMEWLYYADGTTVQTIPDGGGTGRANATDADIDAAYGLLVAAVRWGNSYADDARDLIGNILDHNVDSQNRLLGGDYTPGSTLNTSYQAPGYFRAFADFTGVTRWDAVAQKSADMVRANQLDVINRYNGGNANAGGAGLNSHDMDRFDFRVPATGFTADGNGQLDGRYGNTAWNSDASRSPWRMATAVAWYNDSVARTNANAFNNFVRRQGINNVHAEYNVYGGNLYNWTNSGWTYNSVASAMMLSGNQTERTQAWNKLAGSADDGYYYGSLKAIGMMTAGGWFKNPVSGGPANLVDGDAKADPDGLRRTDLRGGTPTFAAASPFATAALFPDGSPVGDEEEPAFDAPA